MKRKHKLNHIGKRSLSALLALVLTFSLLQSGVFATLPSDSADELTEETAESLEMLSAESAAGDEPAQEEDEDSAEETPENEITALEVSEPAAVDTEDSGETVMDSPGTEEIAAEDPAPDDDIVLISDDGDDPADGEESDDDSDTKHTYTEGDAIFAVYSESESETETETDNSLTFYTDDSIPEAGEKYKDKVVTAVYTGFEENTYTSITDDEKSTIGSTAPWNGVKEKITSVTFDESFKGVQPVATAYWFFGFKNAESISGLEYLDTSEVTSMRFMFRGCEKVTSLNVSGFNTANVTDMSRMFSMCYNLKDLNISGFNTSNVTNMCYMFFEAGVESLTFGTNFNTSKVTTMEGMFASSSGSDDLTPLQSLNLSGFDTSSLEWMGYMFRGSGIKSLTLGTSFTTANVEDMHCLFTSCKNLQSLDLSGFDTSNVEDMYYMFGRCSSLETLTLGSNFKTSNVTTMYGMFAYCSSLTSLDVGGFDTSRVTDMAGMFYGCSGLTELNLSSFDTGAVTDMHSMFSYCSMGSLNLSSFNTSQVTDMSYMFCDCYNLKTLTFGDNFITSAVKNMYCMFGYSSGLEELDLSCFNRKDDDGEVISTTSNVQTMYGMFAYCSSLTTLNFGDFDTSSVVDMAGMFYECSSLKELDLSNFNTDNVVKADDVKAYENFATECPALATITIGDDFDLFAKSESPLVSAQYWYDDEGNFQSVNYLIGVNTPGTYYAADVGPTAFAVYSEDDSSLVFYYEQTAPVVIPDVGDTYDRKTVSSVYTGFDDSDYTSASDVPWYLIRSDITNVSFDKSFADVQPISTAYWFYEFTNAGTFDFTYLDTSEVKDMSHMFYHCSRLTELDLSGFDTASVTDMSFMFDYCWDLEALDLSGFDTEDVERYGSFAVNCPALSTITIDADFDLFKKSESALVSEQYWVDKDNEVVSEHHLIGFTGSGTYYATFGPTAFAIYSETDNSLIFYDTTEPGTVPGLGSEYEGRIVTDVYVGFDDSHYTSADDVPWDSVREDITNVSFDSSFSVVQPIATSYWFYEFTNATVSFDFTNLDTSECKDMSWMFYGCTSLKDLDLSGFDTENVTAYENFATACPALATIKLGASESDKDISGFDLFEKSASPLVSAQYWYDDDGDFQSVNYLIGVTAPGTYYAADVGPTAFAVYSKADASLVFYYDQTAPVVIPNVGDTYDGKTVAGVYTGVDDSDYTSASDVPWYSVRSDIANVSFDASFADVQPVSTAYWFYGFANAVMFDFTNLDTSEVEDYENFLTGCSNLEKITLGARKDDSDISSFDLFARSKNALVTQQYWVDVDYTFESDNYMIGISAPGTYYATTLMKSQIFAIYSTDDNSLIFYHDEDMIYVPRNGSTYNNRSIDEIYTGFDNSAYSSASAVPWHSVREAIKEVSFDESFSDVQPGSMAYWFYEFTAATSFNLEYLDTSNVTTMASAFYECTSLESVNVAGFDVSNVTTMNAMFRGCSKLKEIDLTGWETSSLENLGQFLQDCSSLTEIDLSMLEVSHVTAFANMFNGCTNVVTINVCNWDTSNGTGFASTFAKCTNLTTIYASMDTWVISSSANTNNTFLDCSSNLVGGNGTTWDADHITGDRAHVDTADDPGYFTVLEYTTISGSKIWDDNENQDGLRPEEITLGLYADGEPVLGENDKPVTTTVTEDGEGNWTYAFTDMPKYHSDGVLIKYTVQETGVPDGYEVGDSADGLTVTNSHTPATIDISGTITWDDGNDQDGKRPESVSVQLFGQDEEGGTVVEHSFTVGESGSNEWTWSVADLPVYQSGEKVDYTVVYTGVNSDYRQANDGFNVTYTHTPETTTISGSVIWADNENAYGTRPESVTVCLHAGDEVIYEKTVTAGDEGDWSWKFEDLPVYNSGLEIVYSVTENAVENYNTDITYEEDSCKITNTLAPGKTSVTVIKSWDDENNQDGKRPGSVMVELLQNGEETGQTLTLNEANGWESAFENLKIYSDSQTKFVYTVQEVSVDDYETDIIGDMTEGFVITNSHTPEKIDITGTKIWEDADNQDGRRPDSVTIHLFANGDEVEYMDVTAETADEDGNWTFTFTDLDKYAEGVAINYTITETIPEDAAEYYDYEISGSAEDGFTVTNTHTPETIEKISGVKVWNDDDDRDGLRPDEITVTLLADDEPVETTSLKVVEGFWGWFNSIIAFFSGQQTVTPDENGNWNFSFTDLPKYRDGGIEIKYTIKENEVEGYDTAVSGNAANGFTITNTHEIETVTVAGSKIWDDANDQDGKRPAFIQINLLANGQPVLSEDGTAAVTATVNADQNWSWSFTDLPKYHDGGTEYSYSITENEVNDYETEIDGYDVINSYTPELFNGDGTFKVVLAWDDEADNDGIRPSKVDLTLIKNNTAVEGATLTLTDANADENGNWTGTFEDLPKCENGAEIAYSVKEDYLSGYTYRIEVLTAEDGSTYVQLTNVHVSVKENIEVTKIWDDEDNQDGKRPATISVRLLLNGNLYKTATFGPETEGTTVSEDGNQWSYTMSNIPVDKNGEAVEYTVIEVDVENYTDPVIKTIRGDERTDNGVTYQPYSFEVTNSHTPEQIEISGTKVWNDGSNQDGKRPQYVTMNLLADDEIIESIDVTAPENGTEDSADSDTWAFTFGSYEKYANGREIEYTVTENAVDGYTTTITGNAAEGFTVTNSYTPETTTISGSKTWMDDNNAAGYRPESITVRLHANGNEKVYEQTVTAEDDWSWEFDNLPVYSNGHPITYTLTEDAVSNYDTAYTTGNDGSLNVTNTLDPGNTSVTVEKDWEDAEDQDGIRPENVEVALVKNGVQTGEALILNESNHWEATFTNLAEFEDGMRISYTVEEVSVNGYKSEIDGDAVEGYVITNTHAPEKIDITGTKTWDDANDQDGKRPEAVTVHLLADGISVESQTVTASDDWTWTFTGLDKYAGGDDIVYTIEEAYTAAGYQAAVEDFNITNSHSPSKINITGTKTWSDAENQDGVRPDEITVGLYIGEDLVRDGNGDPLTAVVNEGNGWSYEFNDLDEYAGGEKINYTVVEETVDGYSAAYQNYSIENQHTPEKLNGDGTLGVILRWDDAGNQDGIRPASNTVTLTVNGVEDATRTVVLSDENTDNSGNWIGSFTNLDKYENGKEIAYSVSEGVMPGYTYTAELKFDEDQGIYYIEIINSHAAVTTSITMTKVWDDADNQDGKRPGEITVNLAADGSAVKSRTLTADTEGVTVSSDGNQWTFTFTDLPVDYNGEAIEYSLTEIDVGGYSHTVVTTTGEEVENDGVTYTPYSFTVTNSHSPEKTSVSVTKIWDDEDDQDGLRPQNLTVCLFVGDDPVLDKNGEPVTGRMVPDDDENWTYTFKDLDKYAAGTEIEYRVDEVETEGYEEISLTGDWKDGFTITNRHVPETTDISGNKVWADDGNAAGYRPESITVNLYANGLVEDSQTVTEADGWSWTFENIPVYSGGEKITYVTTETAIDNYSTTYYGFTLTNTLSPGETSVTVVKDWEDSNNQDGKRPESVQVALMNGNDVAVDHYGKDAIITLTEAGGWEGTFREIDEFDETGTRIRYTVREIDTGLEYYDSEVTGDMSDGFVITNSYTPETTSVTGTKTWSDADDQDGIRPETITIYLYADGEPIRSTTVSEKNDWTWTFEDLPKYRNGGVEIEYTIGEETVSGYDTAVSGSDVTNSHTPELLNGDGTFKVILTWDDEANNDGIRPSEVNIKLTRNNTEAEGYALTLTADETDENGNWVGTFTGLPKYENGEEISYSVKEDYLSGYTYRIEVKTDSNGNTYVQLTNVHVSVKEDIEVTKIWDDADDQDGIRPDSITVRLLLNNSLYETVTLTEKTDGVTVSNDGNTWTYTMKDIPVDKNGETVEYTLIEVDVDNYDPDIETARGAVTEDNGVTYQPYSFTVTNSHTPETTSVSGSVIWDDADNQDGLRPGSVTLHILADGTEAATTEVVSDGSDSWAWTYEELPKYRDGGEEILYTVILEGAISGYETEIKDYNIYNSHTPETTTISGSKTWVDDDNAADTRPDSITIRLHANGTVIDSETVTAAEDWSWAFTDLPVYKNGHAIEYLITEDELDDYDAEYTFGADGSFNVTNTLDKGETSVTVIKDWEDAGNQDGIRPGSVTVALMTGGEVAKDHDGKDAVITLTGENHWIGTFTRIDEFDENGVKIQYTLQEVTAGANGYTSTVTGDMGSGFVVTNTYEPETTQVDVVKTWNDADDQDGIRPGSVEVHLLADGEAVLSRQVTAEDGWTLSFADLDKYSAGKEIQYTIEEVPVAGYETGYDGYAITNTHTPETIDISGSKTWNDADDQDGIRPESITIRLYADGTEVDQQTVEPQKASLFTRIGAFFSGGALISAEDDWSWTFTDLPRYADGEEITYTISEDAVEGYTTTISGYNVTNSHTPAAVDISGSKIWDDGNDQDGLRPFSVTVHLLVDGVEVRSTAVTAASDWTYSFKNVDQYAGGKEIKFTVQEDVPEGYEADYDGFTITNTHTPATLELSGSKTWDDGNDQDGIRPDSVTVRLLADGREVRNTAVTAADNWTFSFEDVARYDSGTEIKYTVQEDVPDGYEASYDGFDITNTHAPATVTVTGSKTWDDADNQDGIRPKSITIRLHADGKVIDSMTVTAADGWSWRFADLPAYDSGHEILYTVTEDAVDDYSASYTGNNVLNSYTPGQTSLTVEKVWDDADDQDGIRPNYVEVALLKNGEKTGHKIALSAAGNWEGTFEGLDEYESGTKISYSVAEVDAGGYTTEVTGDQTEGYVITNTHTPETVNVAGSKTWDDADDQDGKRPGEITIRLHADGRVVDSETVTAADDWAWSFTDLPAYDGGHRITYSITEDAVEDYSATYNGYSVTNSYTPGQTSLTVEKIWDDVDDQDGIRPDSVEVTLVKNGTATDETLMLSEANGWEDTFTGLDEYTGGTLNEYTVTEIEPDGYTAVITGSAAEGIEITNTHTPATVSVSGSKTWDDADDQDGRRPGSITIRLHADGDVVETLTVTAADEWTWNFTDLPKYAEGSEIRYTVTEDAVSDYSTSYSGYNVTNSCTPGQTSLTVEKAWDDAGNQDGIRPESVEVELLKNGEETGDTLTLSAENNWEGVFSGLDEYTAGRLNKYTVQESSPADEYTAVVTGSASSGYEIINRHTPTTVNVTGSKTWDDADDQDGKRPDEITIRLLADGTEAASVTVTEQDNWSWTFGDLPQYTGGNEIAYTITEDAVKDYSTTYDGYDVTNTHTPGQTSLTVVKAWDDADDQDGVRPASVEVTLLKNGAATGQTVTLSEQNGWEDTFTGLDEYTAGTKNVYTVDETVPAGYTAGITGDETAGYRITNTHTPATVNVTGSKTWDDNDNQDGIRPDSITVRLLADGREVQSTVVTAADNWAFSFENAAQYDSGKEIVYTVAEDAVAGYEASYNGCDITNTHTPATVDISGSKTWDDGNDQDGIRPDSITIRLLADGTEIDSMTVTELDNWSWTFEGLPQYAAGTEIAYTITEDAVDAYTTAYDGYNVTNTYAPGQISLTVAKEWDDADDQDGMRPDSVEVALLQNGAATGQTITLSEQNGWKDTFTGLDEYTGGIQNVYSVEETAVAGYTSATAGDMTQGYTITNTHEPETADVAGSITWDDENNEFGFRPYSITVHLYADGVEIDSTVVTAEDDWTWDFGELAVYAHGARITYSYTVDLTAEESEHYTVEVDGDRVIIHLINETFSLTVAKIWEDEDDRDGIRPDSVEISLLKNGEETGQTLTLSEANDWADDFTDLEEHTAGTWNEYTVQEAAVSGYTTEITGSVEEGGYVVVNTHTPETVDITGSKTWDDNDDQDGMRPDEITIRLLADGAETDSAVVSAEDGWSWTFEDLAKYENGEEITYTIVENAVEGYSVSYDGYDVTNTYTPEKTSVSVVKTWDDSDDAEGTRPDEITVALLKDGAETGQTLTLSSGDGWQGSFTELDVYEDGEQIEYTVRESEPEGYTSTVTGDAESGYVITNTLVRQETTNVTVTIIWDDNDNAYGVRPSSLTVHLYANGVEIASQVVTAEDGWTWDFGQLDKYDADGNEIVYTFSVDSPEDGHYTFEIDGSTITARYTPDEDTTTPKPTVSGNGGNGGNNGNGGTGSNGGNGGTDRTSPKTDGPEPALTMIALASAAAAAAMAGAVLSIRAYRRYGREYVGKRLKK